MKKARKVNFSLKEIRKDLERYEKESNNWCGEIENAPKAPVVYIGDMDKHWESIETSDGYTIYGASYSSGRTWNGEYVVSFAGDYEKLESPRRNIQENNFPDGSIIMKMNCSADSSHGTIYWAERNADEVVETLLEGGKIMETIIFKDNFPVSGEAYAVGKVGERFFFTWGYEYPYIEKAEELPANDILDGENGIEWYDAEEHAKKAYLEAIEASGCVRNNIKNILNEKDISIRKLSQDLNIAYSNAHDLVNREDLSNTKLGTLLQVADYLEAGIEELYK